MCRSETLRVHDHRVGRGGYGNELPFELRRACGAQRNIEFDVARFGILCAAVVVMVVRPPEVTQPFIAMA